MLDLDVLKCSNASTTRTSRSIMPLAALMQMDCWNHNGGPCQAVQIVPSIT